MKISLPDLIELSHETDWLNLPKYLVGEDIWEEKNWPRIVDALTEEGAKQAVWKLSHLAAILFDVYEGSVYSVKIKARAAVEQYVSYLSFEVDINNTRCSSINLSAQAMAVEWMKSAGDLEEMRQTLDEIEGMGNSRLINQIDKIRMLIPQEFTSARQARKAARELAPEIDVWVRRRILEKHAKPGRETRATGPKM